MAALTVSTVSGRCVLSVDDGGTFDTVADLKLAIQDRLGVGRFQQRLTIGECVLDDGLPLGVSGSSRCALALWSSLTRRMTQRSRPSWTPSGSTIQAVWRVLRSPASPNGPPGSPADQRSPLHEATDFGCAHM
eukprot:7088628-Pyramimonas_sp.AAC.1